MKWDELFRTCPGFNYLGKGHMCNWCIRDTAPQFFEDRKRWSFATFGEPSERGGVGPMTHLQKEIYEVFQALELMEYDPSQKAHEALLEELVDCRFLLEDAVSREGFTWEQYQEASWKKLEKNKNRKWGPKSADGVVEHIRE